MPRTAAEDELVEELPPLDGEEEEESESPADDLDPLPEDEGDPFDDATGESEPVGDEWLDRMPGAVGASELEGAEGDDNLDVGDADMTDLGGGGWLEAGATDLPEVPEEDPELAEGEPIGADAGEEGPLDEGDHLDEEELPSLDADDGGEGEDEHFFDSLAGEDAPLPWSHERWEPTPVVAHEGVGRVVSIAPASRGAVCLGERLFFVELDGAVVPLAAQGLPEGGRKVGCSAGALFVATDRGVYRSDDNGATFAPSDEPAPHDDEPQAVDDAEETLSLPRGFEIATATKRVGTTLAVVRALAQGRLYVVDVREGAIVAELAEPDVDAERDDLSSAALPSDRLTACWDETRGIFWLGGTFGVLALQPARSS